MILNLLLPLLLCCVICKHKSTAFANGPNGRSLFLKRESPTSFPSLFAIDSSSSPDETSVDTTEVISVAMATKSQDSKISVTGPSTSNPYLEVTGEWFSETNQLNYATIIGALMAGNAAGLVLKLTAGLPELELAPSVVSALAGGLAIKYVTDPPNEVTPVLKSILGKPVLNAQRTATAALQRKVNEIVQKIVSVPINIKKAAVRKVDETVSEVNDNCFYYYYYI